MKEPIEVSLEAPVRRFPPYPEYKDSGLEWLGNVPKDWELARLRFMVQANPPKAEVRQINPDTLVSFIPMEALGEYGGLELDVLKRIEDIQDGYTYFRNGDVVIAKITPCFENGKGALADGLENGIAFGTTELHVLRPLTSLDARFLFYLTISRHFREIGASIMYGAGGQKRVPEDFIKDFSHPIPDRPLQRVIASFLDRETAKIDALIAKKERLIELLREKRTTLITQALAKGLDSNAPMKDSGVEWLSEVPAHWDIKRVRDIAESLQTGPFGSQLHSGEYVPGGIPVINPAQLQDSQIIPDWSCAVDEITAQRLQRHRLAVGDIVLGRRGELGRCALTTPAEEGWLCGTGSLRISLRMDAADPRFLVLFFTTNGARDWLALQSVGSTMQNLNTAIVGRIPIAVPPVPEQVAIVEQLEMEGRRIERLVAQIREAIDRLKDLRTALISAAVTGKIDVRKEPA